MSDDNPYAAPFERPVALPLPPSTPTRRVEFRGTIEHDDVWRPPRPWGRSVAQVTFGLILCLVWIIGTIPRPQPLLQDDWIRMTVILCGGTVASGVLAFLIVKATRALVDHWRRGRFKAEDVEGWFAAEAIEICSRGLKQTLGWHAFVGYYRSSSGEPILWLLRPGIANALPMPRRFFGSEADWRRFEELVAGRLPLGGRAGAGPQAAPPPLPAVEHGIQFSGTVEGKHIARARQLVLAARKGPEGSTLKVWFFVLLLGGGSLYLLWQVGVGTMAVIPGVILVLLIPAWLFRRAQKIELRGVVEAGGIRVIEPLASTWFDWASYLEYRRDEQPTPMVVLMLSEDRMHVFPREVFATDETWQDFLARVDAHVRPAP